MVWSMSGTPGPIRQRSLPAGDATGGGRGGPPAHRPPDLTIRRSPPPAGDLAPTLPAHLQRHAVLQRLPVPATLPPAPASHPVHRPPSARVAAALGPVSLLEPIRASYTTTSRSHIVPWSRCRQRGRLMASYRRQPFVRGRFFSRRRAARQRPRYRQVISTIPPANPLGPAPRGQAAPWRITCSVDSSTHIQSVDAHEEGRAVGLSYPGLDDLGKHADESGLARDGVEPQ